MHWFIISNKRNSLNKTLLLFLVISGVIITLLGNLSFLTYADKLKSYDGVMYLYSDNDENLGEYTGWAKTSKGKLYYCDGEKVTGKFVIDGVCYKFSKKGYSQGKYTGWLKLNDGKKYYKNGVVVRNKWLKVGNSYSYAGVDGYMIVENVDKKIPDLPELLEEKEKDLCQKYLEWDNYAILHDTVDGYNVAAYLGTYKGQDIVIFERKEMAEFNVKQAAEMLERYESYNTYLYDAGYTPLSYSDGTFLQLDDLYNDGYVTDSDVIKINYYYNRFLARIGVVPKTEKKFPKLKPLTEEQKLNLLKNYIKYYKRARFGESTDDYEVIQYFGTYNGCEVAVIYAKETDVIAMEKEIYVAGYEISLSSGSYSLLLHRNGTFIPVEEAYEKGYLTKSDIEKIVYYSVARD